MRRDSYLPSSPATLQALDRMEYAMTNAIALLSPDPFLLLPVTPPPPSRHVWDDQRNLHLAAFIVGLA